MHRLLALCTAMACLLCGCGATGDGAGQTAKEELTIVLWDYDKTSYDRRLVETFENTHPGVYVRVISYADAYYDEKMEALLVGGKPVDVVFTRVMESLRTLHEYNLIVPLDEFVTQYGLDLAGSPDLNAMRYDGALYGVPYRKDRYVLVYNCDLFDRAGVEYPASGITWEQVHALAPRLQSGLPADAHAMMVLPMDVQWVASGRRVRAEGGAGLRPIMELLLDLQNQGAAPVYGDCIAQDIQQQCFELGTYGMYIGGTWYLNYLATDQKAGRFDFRWGVTTAPYWQGDAPEEGAVIRSGLSICRQSRNKALAWEFIRFASGADGARIMAEEQMMPAYMNDEIAEVYRRNFMGTVLDPLVYQQSAQQAETSIDAKQMQRMCEAFRACLTGRKTLDEAVQMADGRAE